jgi:transcriptional regulator with XRE-family HTH domain
MSISPRLGTGSPFEMINPAQSRNSLGRKLRQIRKAKGIDGPHALADLMGGKYSFSAILKRERAEQKISLEYIDDFSRALNLSGKEKDDLIALAKLSIIEFDPWKAAKSLQDLHEEFQRRLASAELYQSYDPITIHGLFQTYNYAYAVLRMNNVDAKTAEDTARLRQRIAEKEFQVGGGKKKGTRILQIVSAEEALYRVVGSPEVMKEQIERLLELDDDTHVSYGILPSDVSLQVATWCNLNVFDSTFATIETLIGAVHTGDEDQIRQLEGIFNSIFARSAFGKKRQKLLEKAVKHHGKAAAA